MTQNEFVTICLEYYIDPAIAVESEQVKQAIKSGSFDQLREVLENEF